MRNGYNKFLAKFYKILQHNYSVQANVINVGVQVASQLEGYTWYLPLSISLLLQLSL